MEYIIVQAGGKGSRMQILTRNKPKALVPINNLPLIFHLFKKYPDKKFIIIGDYKYDVLIRYLKTFADVEYQTVCSSGRVGTCAGLQSALSLVPNNERFMLIWCDLVLPDDYEVPDTTENIIGISKNFVCRWKWENGSFSEERSDQHGVAGLFVFSDKKLLSDVPEEGEFVRWLSGSGINFKEQPLNRTQEYGIYSEWDKIPKMRCRPFNRITVKGDRVFKEGIDEQGRKLAIREVAWYKKIQEEHFSAIPIIYSYSPLSMELIDGKNIYEYTYVSSKQKRYILENIVNHLKTLHTFGSIPCDRDSYVEAYLGKTYERLRKVRKLVPFADAPTVRINGVTCRNIFFHQEEVANIVMQYLPHEFVFLHGDCTFSNIILRNDIDPVFIDPRGYFGNHEFYGDVAYDWVKLYYSLVSNYDQFNLKKFSLDITDKEVKLDIASNNWEDMEDYFFELVEGEVTRRQMKMLLAITWLSLTTYAWEDYDSICGAFYNGLLYLEEALEMESAYSYFDQTMVQLTDALKGIHMSEMEKIISECYTALKAGNKIVASGLGKNVPICEKFEGTMLSLGLEARFLHTNSAVHGDLGMIKSGDVVIVLTKSGSTAESIYLVNLLENRKDINLWLISCDEQGILAGMMQKKIIIPLENEGDPWNIMPNNSSTLYLIFLQTIAMQLIKRFGITLDEFRKNHPGGAIGAKLQNRLN